jgi:NADH-quinone oxidoreductase subunit C
MTSETQNDNPAPAAPPPRAADLLLAELKNRLGEAIADSRIAYDEVTIEIPAARLLEACTLLRDEPSLGFEMLVDLCGVDYSAYGQSEWDSEDASGIGFSRGVDAHEAGRLGITTQPIETDTPPGRRFAAVSHLLSIRHNRRVRVKCFAEDDEFPVLPSVIGIWNSVNWYEREAFDLFGIVFEGHPDLRRLLTDYGFIGHPFRKDFPLTGNVEMIYDPDRQRVVYQPVSIEPRVLVPRVIRHDNRYADGTDN